MRILGFAGSLRTASFNRALLRAAEELAPKGMDVTIADLGDLPLYNADIDAEVSSGAITPAPVLELRESVRTADAVLMAVVEYNWGPSGVLKNAVDWLSRPPTNSPLFHKPVAIVGTSPGPAGTGRAQLQLRQSLLFTKSRVLTEPDVQLGFARDLFDDELKLVNEDARQLLARQLRALMAWAALLESHVVE